MKERFRIVFYAVNGTGTGHVTRLLALAKWMRRYATWLPRGAEFYFLTSSEADQLLFREDFASFKVPSKTIVTNAKLDRTTYLALAKQWVWHTLGLLRPDLFVVDTFPQGSFGELPAALDLAKKRALVARPMLHEFAGRTDVQNAFFGYDLLLVPEAKGDASLHLPKGMDSRTRYYGPVAHREAFELLSREDARRVLGIETDRQVVYVSAGGGGDPTASDQLLGLVRSLRSVDRFHIVAGAGPLFRGSWERSAHVTFIHHEPVASLVRAFDVAVSAAGYNTTVELGQGGVPTVFLPQRKVADDQHARAERAAKKGGVRVLSMPVSTEMLVANIDELLKGGPVRSVEKNHARELAADLMRLIYPFAEVEAAEEMIDDAFLSLGLETSFAADVLADLVRTLGIQKTGFAAFEGVVRAARQAGIPSDVALRVARSTEVSFSLAPDRLRVFREVVESFADYSDWTSAATIVDSISIRAMNEPERFSEGIAQLLRECSGRSLVEIAAIAHKGELS